MWNRAELILVAASNPRPFFQGPWKRFITPKDVSDNFEREAGTRGVPADDSFEYARLYTLSSAVAELLFKYNDLKLVYSGSTAIS